MYSLPRIINEAEIDALNLPPDLALADEVFHRACLYEDDTECWKGGVTVNKTQGQQKRRVIIANGIYLPGGGRSAKAQWQCIHPRLAGFPSVDANKLTAMMKKEVVLA